MAMDKPEWQAAAEIVRDAGGTIVGRTKLQKVGYLMELAGLGAGFDFEYRHYGPYSEDLADSIRLAAAFDLVIEEEKRANWGGVYSIFRATDQVGRGDQGQRAEFAEAAAGIDSIELELAATAAYLSAVEDCVDPWEETARRKPEKVGEGRLDRAKAAYKKLMVIRTPMPLPKII